MPGASGAQEGVPAAQQRYEGAAVFLGPGGVDMFDMSKLRRKKFLNLSEVRTLQKQKNCT